MAKAFLVYSPESSGNRLIKRILRATQYDNEDVVIGGFSIPSNRKWLSIYDNSVRYLQEYDTVHFITMVRDFWAVQLSQVKNNDVKDVRHAQQHIVRATKQIFRDYANLDTGYDIDVNLVSYEALISNPLYLTKLLERYNLTLVRDIEPIYNGNELYYVNRELADRLLAMGQRTQ